MLPFYTKRVYPASVNYTECVCETAERVYSLFGMDAKTHRRQVGQRLRQARKAADLTQQQAADFLTNHEDKPVPASRIGNYEQGLRLIDPVTLKALSKLYGASPSAIYGFDDAPKGTDESDLLKKYRETDERGKRNIQGIADAEMFHELKRAGR